MSHVGISKICKVSHIGVFAFCRFLAPMPRILLACHHSPRTEPWRFRDFPRQRLSGEPLRTLQASSQIFTDLHSTQLHPNFKPCCDKPCCLLVFQQLHLHNFLHEIATQINKIYPIGWLICALEQFGKWSPNGASKYIAHPVTGTPQLQWNWLYETCTGEYQTHKCVLGCAPLKMEKWTLKAGDLTSWDFWIGGKWNRCQSSGLAILVPVLGLSSSFSIFTPQATSAYHEIPSRPKAFKIFSFASFKGLTTT